MTVTGSRALFLVFFAVFIAVGLDSSVRGQAPKRSGKYTSSILQPKTAHIQNDSDAGKVKRIRGKLYCCDEGIPSGAIISVYSIHDGEEKFLYSYLVGASGKFDFKDLKKGTYLLKTGTTDGYFNSLYVRVMLAPDDKDSSSDEIEIRLEVGT